MVTFGHRNAKGDLKTPQNLLLQGGQKIFLDHTEILLKNSFNISITAFCFSYLSPPPKRDIAL